MKLGWMVTALALSLGACGRAGETKNGTNSPTLGSDTPSRVNAAPSPTTDTANGMTRGGSDGGGGDSLYPWSDSAWFVGQERSVNACIERAANFSVDDAGVRAAIKGAYKVWDVYLKAKTGPENHTGTVDIPTHVTINPKCIGNEDLKFYFGVMPSHVKKIWERFNDPIAFAYRTSFKTKKWDAGYIWIADDATATRLLNVTWSSPTILRGALTHEIGHTGGTGHVSGTLMREDILGFLKLTAQNTPSVADVMTANIDWSDDLIENGFNFNYLGNVEHATDTDDYGRNLFFKFFQELMGRAPKGKVSSRLWRKDKSFHLVMVDDSGEQDFEIEDIPGFHTVNRQKQIFYIYHPDEHKYPQFQFITEVNGSFPDVMIGDGLIKTANGVKARVSLQRGGGAFGAWELDYEALDNSGQWALFGRRPGGLPPEAFRQSFSEVAPN